MPELSLTTFFNGASTAYFAINAFNLLARPKPTRLQKLLGAVCVYWTLATAKDMLLLVPGGYTQRMLDAVLIADGWSAVTFACVLFELTMPGWVTWRRTALLALPFAAFTAVYALAPCAAVASAYMAFLAVFGLAVLLAGYFKAAVYMSYIYENFSDVERMDISWLKSVYVADFVYMSLWVIVSLVNVPAADSLIYVAGIVLWQITLHYCADMKPVRPESYAETGTGDIAGDEPEYAFAVQMEAIVENEELYLDPKLSLNKLAERLGTNRTYLSKYFNNVKGTTFYDYVNALRIHKKSVPLMQEHPEYAFDYIARQSGFNSLSTFQRAFRKYTGTTPGKFIGIKCKGD